MWSELRDRECVRCQTHSHTYWKWNLVPGLPHIIIKIHTLNLATSIQCNIVSIFSLLPFHSQWNGIVTYPTTRPGVESVFSLFSSDNLGDFDMMRFCHGSPTRMTSQVQDTPLASQVLSWSFLEPLDVLIPLWIVCSTYPNGLTWCQSFHGVYNGFDPLVSSNFFWPSFVSVGLTEHRC